MDHLDPVDLMDSVAYPDLVVLMVYLEHLVQLDLLGEVEHLDLMDHLVSVRD